MTEGNSALDELRALEEDPKLAQLDAMLREFNLFDVLGIARREVRHSALLAWLLNPGATHGLGTAFLRSFLRNVARRAEISGIGKITTASVDSWGLEQVRVRTERQNIDVLIEGISDGFVCPIENKINIGEHSGQLAKYMKIVDSQWPGWDKLPIFLTPDGKEPEGSADKERYVPYSHEKVASVIDRVLESDTGDLDLDVASLLRQYTYTLRRRVMETTSDVESLAFEIHRKHSGAIRRINKALENKEKRAASIAKEVLGTPIEDASNGLLVYRSHHPNIRKLGSPYLDECFSDQKKLLDFEVKYERDINLYLWVLPGEHAEDTRRTLVDLPWKSSAPFSLHAHKVRKLPKGWTWLYRKPVISRNDETIIDQDAARTKIEEAIRILCSTDYFPLVNAIRWEFARIPWDSLDSVVHWLAPNLHPGTHRTASVNQGDKRVRFHSPPLDDIPGFYRGSDEAYAGRMAAFEVMCLDEPSLGLYLDIRPGDEQLRRKIMDGAQKAGVAERDWREWHGFQCLRLKTIIDTEFPDLFDGGKVQGALNEPIADFYQKDYFPLVNAIRAEFGLPEVEPT